MARPRHLASAVLVAFVFILSTSYLLSGRSAWVLDADRRAGLRPQPVSPDFSAGFHIGPDTVPSDLFEGDSIAPELGNATLKAELGRATWHFLHTLVARFPEKPSPSDRKALEAFFYLFGRLYPCGDCARHFRGLLAKYPPQSSSRNAAAGWACFIHNMVNERLRKPEFDCSKIGDFYDCGCGDEKDAKVEKKSARPDKG